jgi:hypothetical protein
MDNKNRYNLRLSSLIRRQAAEDGTVEDDLELLNILPSYQMYRNTISKNLTPTAEDLRTIPPSYELTPQTSASSIVSQASSNADYFQGIDIGASLPNEEDEDARNQTIIGNIHKLKRLTSTNKDISKALKIQIFLTKEVGRVGVEPEILDPSSIEMEQGDYVYGFILVTNRTNYQIPFDMFSVMLEGAEINLSNKEAVVQYPTSVIQFLTMFDFAASWNDASVDRLANEHNDPYIPLETYDPVDNSRVQLDHRKIFEPNVTYKKFFGFKLPEKLLDSSCEHGLVKHLQLPPTLGVSKNEAVNSLRQKWKTEEDGNSITSPLNELKLDSTHKYSSYTNDFAFPVNSVSYSISARVIGKASDYEKLAHNGMLSPSLKSVDEYVVANEVSVYLRVIPRTNPIFELNRALIVEEARLIYSNMVSHIQEKIALGKEMSQSTPEMRDTSTQLRPTESFLELSKMQQSYYRKPRQPDTNPSISNRSSDYHTFYPYKKKSMFGHSKVLGLAVFHTPKKEYRASYVPFPKFARPEAPPPDTKISIPITLEYFNSERSTAAPPEFKKVAVELVVCTIRSKSLPIPVVIHPDMMFDNRGKSSDNFDMITIKRFQTFAHDISKLMKLHGAEALEIDKQMVRDIKCLANLATKYDHLKFTTATIQPEDSTDQYQYISTVPWKTKQSEKNPLSVDYFKKFNVNIDLKDAVQDINVPSEYCLVPDFQTCLVARIYYLKLKFKCISGEKIYLRVPLVIQKESYI